ncbi:hypothetical protein ACTWPB_28725 [Nocardia sp. IBHARD005]|uniref:hypothetical protein n=1 Tax=Nocardia sp. IBHARD005 TaxID=3457765 RepID=UPI00405A28BB
MNKNIVRAAIAAAAIVPMVALGAGTAAAIPTVNPGVPTAPFDGEQRDSAATNAYTCVWVGPGIGFGSNPVGLSVPVTGLFFGPGVVNGVCLGPSGIATGIGFVE